MHTYELSDLNNLPKLEKNTCIMGCFDGVHLAHQDLFNLAKIDGLKKLVICFKGLFKDETVISSFDERKTLIESCGIDYLLFIEFELIKDLSFSQFHELLSKLNVDTCVCGTNFKYGNKKEGNFQKLSNDFKVIVAKDIMIEKEKISTSLIKKLLTDGDIILANKMLGRLYSVCGIVVNGNKIGRKLGFKTANIEYKNYHLPKNGAYMVYVYHNNKQYLGMANIGYNPTLNEQNKKRVEVHILNFDKQIYNENIRIEFIEFLREERKFHSKEELVNSLNEILTTIENRRNIL